MIRGNVAVVRHGATAPSTQSGAVLLELSPSRMRDSGWDQLPPDVRFAGEALQKMRAPPWIAIYLNQPLTETPSCEAEHMATQPANVKISLANRYSRLRPVSNENRLVGRPLGVAYGTRLPSRDVRIHGESGVRKTTPSVTMLLFWSAKLIQAKGNLPWSHSSHWPLWRSGPAYSSWAARPRSRCFRRGRCASSCRLALAAPAIPQPVCLPSVCPRAGAGR